MSQSTRAPGGSARGHAHVDRVIQYLAAGHGDALDRLEQLVRIPSISAPGHASEPLGTCADLVAELARKAGLEHVELIDASGGPAYVYADWLHAAGRPTMLLYAHYDVQPPGRLEDWTVPPFEPQVRAGRLFGRGTADDKAGILVHLSAIEAWLRGADELPINVRLLIEGEEENGSPHCQAFLDGSASRLACDAMVLADSANVEVGKPSITHSLRGATTLTIEVRAMPGPVHSGIWGGVVPDALMALCKTLAALTDEQGRIAAPGFADGLAIPPAVVGAPALTESVVRSHTGLLESVSIMGDHRLTLNERVWSDPCLTIRGLDAPPVVGSPNVIQPAARAQINVRLGLGQDPQDASDRLADHIRRSVPWGLEVAVTRGAAYPAWYEDPTGPVYQAAARATARAFGHPVTFVGMGGSVPLLSWLRDAIKPASVLMTGVEDPLSAAHGSDESLDLDSWHKATLAEALLFEELAADGATP
jgi:acetylornithine deacetylase/succinyl-diaminopimelate desuccinylase-like protein